MLKGLILLPVYRAVLQEGVQEALLLQVQIVVVHMPVSFYVCYPYLFSR